MITRHRTARIPLAPLFFLLLTWGVLSGRLAAQDSEISVMVQVAGQVGQVTTASQEANFSVRPSSPLNLILRCLNNATGQVIPFCDLSLTWQARANSGGHNHHSSSRPKGTFAPASGNSGASGQLPTTYTSPDPSGIIDITVRGTLPNGTPVNPASYTIGVEIPDLVVLVEGANYDLVGETGTHPVNHYGTPTFVGMLKTVAGSYAAAFPGQILSYNDMSMPYGGLFDINANWSPPHREHRTGQSCDLRLVPARQRARLLQLLTAAGFGRTFKEGDHWHIRE